MIHSKWLLAILLVYCPLIFNIPLAAGTNLDNATGVFYPEPAKWSSGYEEPAVQPGVQNLQMQHERIQFTQYSSLSILIYSLLLCVLITLLIIKQNIRWDPMSVIRFFGLTFIVTTGMYLIVSGYSDQQIAGMMGLLGSLAGYLLGESSVREKETAKDKS